MERAVFPPCKPLLNGAYLSGSFFGLPTVYHGVRGRDLTRINRPSIFRLPYWGDHQSERPFSKDKRSPENNIIQTTGAP